MAKTASIEKPSVLAFERKLDPSDALFAAGNWGEWADDWAPVVIREKSVRGTISNCLKSNEMDPAKLNASVEKPNLQTIDVASLPADCDTLRARFTLRILGGVGVPSACNEPAYQKKLANIMASYKKETGFEELARRYASNLANARFLWRNRLASEDVLVNVCHVENGLKKSNWQFASFSYPMDKFDELPNDKNFNELVQVIADVLSQESGGYGLLEVTAYARMGLGQEVFPSQELILDAGTSNKSKTLYAVDGIAGMHSQKIGNALRTIDTWYPDAAYPIAVEPYGAVTSQGMAYRPPKDKKDFYNLSDQWILHDEKPDMGNRHFVVAVFIRGGVFGQAGK